jgi:hypothetical protein
VLVEVGLSFGGGTGASLVVATLFSVTTGSIINIFF